MLINAGIEIHFSATVGDDNSSLGITNGVGTYPEGTGEITAGINYRDNVLVQGWTTGFSDSFDLRTYVRPQIVGDVTIRLSNVTGIYDNLLAYGYDLDGKRVELVFFTDDLGTQYPAPSYYIKDVKPSGTFLTLTLADITTQQHIDMSRPISGDKWYPVVIGGHENGIYISNGLTSEPVNDLHSWDMIPLVVGTFEVVGTTSKLGVIPIDFVPKDTSVSIGNYVSESSDGIYFSCTDGDGSGKSVKIEKLQDLAGDRLRADTIGSVYIDGNGIPMFTASDPMRSETSVGELIDISTVFYSDLSSNLTPTESAIKNKDKEPVSADALILDGNEITVNAPTIVDNKIVGHPMVDFSEIEYNSTIDPGYTGQASSPSWTYEGSGVWVGYTSGGDANTPDSVVATGVIGNIIDRDQNTELSTVVSYTTTSLGNQSDPLFTTQSFYVDNPEDVEILLSDIQVDANYTSTSGTEAKTMSLPSVRVHAYWEQVAPYAAISDPVLILDVTAEDLSPSGGVNFKEYFFQTWMPAYYGNTGTNRWYDVQEDSYQPVSGPTDIFKVWTNGSDKFALNNQATDARLKKPTGFIITVDIRFFCNWEAVPTPADPVFSLEIKAKSFAGYKSETTVSFDDFVLQDVEGRPYTTFQLYQEHLTKLLNWSLDFKTEPTEGWGLGECTDADYTFNVTNTTPVRSQWKEPSNLTTKAQIDIVQRESWNTMTNTSTGKVWSSFLNKLGAESPDNSYVESSQVKILSPTVFDEQDAYNTFTIEYDYDISTNTYNKSISIDQVSKASYDTSYVTGITDPVEASNVWAKCNVLYGVAKSEKRLPDNLSKLRNIYEEEDALQYILNYIQLFGVNDGSAYIPNWLVVASHPVDDLFDNPAMATIGYTGVNIWSGQEATGVVIGRKYKSNPKSVEITSIVKPVVIVGRTIELETNTDRIIEDETNTNRIVEVGA